MIYAIKWTSTFKRSYKLAKKRGLPIDELKKIVDKLRTDTPLPAKFKDHELSARYVGLRECHIKPDWLLLYLKEDDILTLTLVDTGSHADLF